MKIEKIYVGSWFQRTTLHLSEIYDFLHEASSPLDLDKEELEKLRDKLQVKDLKMTVSDLEHLDFTGKDGVEVKIFEDGLIVLSKAAGGDIKSDIASLTSYYEKELSSALKCLFSLGAPIPKELANIKNVYPYFLIGDNVAREDIQGVFSDFNEEKYIEIAGDDFEVYRGDKLYFINKFKITTKAAERFIEEQIFMREFKGQLHRYLNLHRIIWERIEDVKERGHIKGRQISVLRSKVESYGKTINLIGARIGQMSTYLHTRESIAQSSQELAPFDRVFHYKYETLADTLAYIEDIWGMTQNYVDSALRLFSDLEAESTDTSVENLTVVTSMGVGATLLGLFAEEALPSVTLTGIGYFLILAAIGYLAKRVLEYFNQRRSYEISDVEIDTNIK